MRRQCQPGRQIQTIARHRQHADLSGAVDTALQRQRILLQHSAGLQLQFDIVQIQYIAVILAAQLCLAAQVRHLQLRQIGSKLQRSIVDIQLKHTLLQTWSLEGKPGGNSALAAQQLLRQRQPATPGSHIGVAEIDTDIAGPVRQPVQVAAAQRTAQLENGCQGRRRSAYQFKTMIAENVVDTQVDIVDLQRRNTLAFVNPDQPPLVDGDTVLAQHPVAEAPVAALIQRQICQIDHTATITAQDQLRCGQADTCETCLEHQQRQPRQAEPDLIQMQRRIALPVVQRYIAQLECRLQILPVRLDTADRQLDAHRAAGEVGKIVPVIIDRGKNPECQAQPQQYCQQDQRCGDAGQQAGVPMHHPDDPDDKAQKEMADGPG